ncbi:hypothetical protein J1N35_045168 [Gossypium stocksii]|uniref:Uncharacterized protein n=1 Tax=Gossypium stocksii TaxID=47602 RepID=A0A9D3UAN0_9ROSI|nr:hypothetical protein J1N35_045168 [Gossypium stocksii]
MLKLKLLVAVTSQQFANAKMLHKDVITFSLSAIFQGRCGNQFCAFAPFIGLWELGGKSQVGRY